ncbi:basic salivary proline-rich protein 2-like [Molothrus ater]|uniref:basic salivary proline-rich protein 2-like n=1 Tax=Molothrus ater TaxID=84834 RepID=UPI00174E02F1|nr:basic salivary proline-rich protein 2-like [Molothrus ater]
MLPDRDIPARNPRGPSCSRPRAATPPRSGEPRAPPTTTRGYRSSPSPPGFGPGTPLGPDPHSGRRLGSPPRRRPPPGHPPRCGIAGTLPWRPRRASPRPVPAVGGISSIFPPPSLFLSLSFPRSRITPEPKSLTSAGKTEQRMREAPSGPARPLPPAGARSAGRPQPHCRGAGLGSAPRARLAPAAGRARHARLAPAPARAPSPQLPGAERRGRGVCGPCRCPASPLRSPRPLPPRRRRGSRGHAAAAGRDDLAEKSIIRAGKQAAPRGVRRREERGRQGGQRAPLGRPFPPRGQDGGDPCRHRRGARAAARPAQAPPPPAELRLPAGWGGGSGGAAAPGRAPPRPQRSGQRPQQQPRSAGPAARPEPARSAGRGHVPASRETFPADASPTPGLSWLL